MPKEKLRVPELGEDLLIMAILATWLLSRNPPAVGRWTVDVACHHIANLHGGDVIIAFRLPEQD